MKYLRQLGDATFIAPESGPRASFLSFDLVLLRFDYRRKMLAFTSLNGSRSLPRETCEGDYAGPLVRLVRQDQLPGQNYQAGKPDGAPASLH